MSQVMVDRVTRLRTAALAEKQDAARWRWSLDQIEGKLPEVRSYTGYCFVGSCGKELARDDSAYVAARIALPHSHVPRTP